MNETNDRWFVASLDTELRISFADREFSAIFGVPPEQLRQRCVLELLHPSVSREQGRTLSLLAQAGQGEISTTTMLSLPDGQATPAMMTALAIPQNRIVVTLCVVPYETPERRGRQRDLSLLDAQLLEAVAAGVPTTRLATRLNLSRQGLEYHLGRMARKFGVTNRTGLVAKAYSSGLFRPDCWPPRVAPEFMA
ncbi:helix-turn-helix transcriptional regulator [Kutzneria buriramensis]|uniref:DNA-binding CsgD family transcriptional regulator n=1 Tax=Kutzneria buriramensis TaxID=1045776 RepID=A0A3E0GVK9_9PSEU|nr:LuxR C-terminal-related transcriptional regulator [Kutzneria buriramensis]REH26977.1 DNA-binding CsgD family transcriptional regulator [Kutzneria buriramensis]